MKKIILSLSFSLVLMGAFAQSEKYTKTMQDKVAMVDTSYSLATLKDLSASFERIADAEKTQWLPYYYAAYTQVLSGLMMMDGSMQGGMADKLDPISDKAEAMLNKAEGLTKNNSEIYIVKKMIANLRMMADPMNRYMQYGPIGQEALETARKLNPENPRIYLLEGQDKFFTPEQFGGSKTEAKKLFETSIAKFKTFKPATSIDPNWGKPSAEHFLAEAGK